MHKLQSDGQTYSFPSGATYLGSKYGFVICRSNAEDMYETIAHEIGHMLGTVPDLYHGDNANRNYQLDIDENNLMNNGSGTFLRKDQWDMINKNAIDRMEP